MLGIRNLAVFGAIAAIAFASSCLAQGTSPRLRLRERVAEGAGLLLLALGLIALTLAPQVDSLALLIVGAVAAGGGHGLGFLNAQDELNRIAPPERRGEVTSAFITGIYLVVAAAVISTGLLDQWLSLTIAVGAVAVALAVTALAGAAWQLLRLET
jgi:hypothetical protein